MLRDKSGSLKNTNFSIDVQILKSNYGTPMSMQGKYIFYQLEPDEATAFWSENLPEHIIKKLEGKN